MKGAKCIRYFNFKLCSFVARADIYKNRNGPCNMKREIKELESRGNRTKRLCE
jgi:hypothetical protein